MTALFDAAPFAVEKRRVVHPAKFSDPLLPVIGDAVRGLRPLLDPFAGTGKIHRLGGDTWGVEIEPEWASLHPRTIVGDALRLPFRDGSFRAVATSPTYGNRLADSHNARDGSVRHSYTHDLRAMTGDPDRQLHPNNSGVLHWGPKYRAFHEAAWREVARVLGGGGVFVCNVSDHIRNRQVQPVCAWHREVIPGLGFDVVDVVDVGTSRLKYGENAERVPSEEVQVYRRWAVPAW